MNEEGRGTCVQHREFSDKIDRVLDGVTDIRERLARGDGKFDLFDQRLEQTSDALNAHLERHEQYASKIIIGLLLAALVAFGGLVASGKFSERAAAASAKP